MPNDVLASLVKQLYSLRPTYDSLYRSRVSGENRPGTEELYALL